MAREQKETRRIKARVHGSQIKKKEYDIQHEIWSKGPQTGFGRWGLVSKDANDAGYSRRGRGQQNPL